MQGHALPCPCICISVSWDCRIHATGWLSAYLFSGQHYNLPKADFMFNDIEPNTISQLLPTHIGANVWIGDHQIKEILSLDISHFHADHNKLRLRFYHDQIQQEGSLLFDGAEQLLGQVAEVIINDRNSSGSTNELKNIFIVTKISFDHNAMNEGIIILEGMAPTSMLDGAPHYESFYQSNLASIAKTVCKPLEGMKSKVIANPSLDTNIGYVCRYGESTWNFLKRISSETGQWLYFNGKELIFGQAESQQAADLVYGQNCYKLNMSMQARPVQAGYFDYDASGNKPFSNAANSETDMANSDRGFAFGKAKSIYGEGNFTHPAALPANTEVLPQIGKSNANAVAADLYLISGESTVHDLRVGVITNLKMVRAGVSQEHSPVRIISVNHFLDATGHYHNSFEAISAQSITPPQISFIKPFTTSMPAEVIDNKDPLGIGRVQVKFLGWKQDHSQQQTDWIRILTPDAGSSSVVSKNRGYVFIPEPGDQVMVDFEQNNPDRPFVQGSIFHGSNGSGGGNANNVKSIVTRSGHTIELNDDNNGTHIIIKDPSGNEIHFDTQGKNITVTAPETITLTAKNIVMNADQSITASAGVNVTTSAGATVTTSAGVNIQSTAAKDLTMMATNIIGTADDSVTHNASKSITKRGNTIEASATENDFNIYSAKKVVNTSGEKGKLF